MADGSVESKADDQRALMARALEEIKRLRKENAKLSARDSIAVVGIGCRFPGLSDGIEKFWGLLDQGRSGIVDVPEDRWDKHTLVDPDPQAPGKIVSARGGYLTDALAFDSGFFGIAPIEAESLDPQQALLLEVTWQALEQGNINPRSLYNTRSGVFVGASSPDNAMQLMGAEWESIGPYHGSGCAFGPLAGRLSFYYGLLGPSFVVDTACSSSLVSIHLASDSLRKGECDLAIAAGVQLNTHPGFAMTFSKARMLSPDGLCRTFDQEANGYVRGEGCGVLILKRLADAEASGDHIMAVLRGSAVNQDGPSGGLTVPSGPAQSRVIREALHDANLSPADIAFIEAHGTGTSLGDPIEVGALGDVFAEGRSSESPLIIGSLKTNIGHLEAAAGVAGAIKTILSLYHRRVPRHLNLENPNALIPWDDLPVIVPTDASAPLPQEQILNAGVSSFGFSGTNAHLVFSNYASKELADESDDLPSATLLALSAHDEVALASLAREYRDLLAASSHSEMHQIVCGAWHNRAHLSKRLAVAGRERRDFVDQLSDAISGLESSGHLSSESGPAGRHLAFVFPGQGSQFSGMGRSLYLESEVFRAAFDQASELIEVQSGLSAKDLILRDHVDIDLTGNAQVSLFCLQYGLIELWQSYGVQPTRVIGHSVGEVAAALAAGVFSLPEAAKLVGLRARLMGEIASEGGMLAIGLSDQDVRARIHGTPLTVASVNGPQSTVVSGPLSALDELTGRMVNDDIRHRRLSVSHAFHSPIFSAAAERFRSQVSEIDFQAPTMPMGLNLTGELSAGDAVNGDYWADQIVSTVRFYDAARALQNIGVDTWLELGPQPTLLPALETAQADISETVSAGRFVTSLKKGADDLRGFLSAGAELWMSGYDLDLPFPRVRAITLPAYPFERKRFSVLRATNTARSRSRSLEDGTWQELVSLPRFATTVLQRSISLRSDPELADHRVFGKTIVAGAFHVALTVEAVSTVLDVAEFSLQDVEFPRALHVHENEEVCIQAVISRQSDGSNLIELLSLDAERTREISHLQARLVSSEETPLALSSPPIGSRGQVVNVATIYEAQRTRQIETGPSYVWLQDLVRQEHSAVGTLEGPEAAGAQPQWALPPGLLDSCFGIFVFLSGVAPEDTYVPVGFDRLYVKRPQSFSGLKAEVRVTSVDLQAGNIHGDINVIDGDGSLLLSLEGVRARRTNRELLLGEDSLGEEESYTVAWEPIKLAKESVQSGSWLLVKGKHPVGELMATQLREAGGEVAVIDAPLSDPDQWPQEIDARLQAALAPDKGSGAVQGVTIVNCLPLDTALMGVQDFEHQIRAACGSVIQLLKALDARDHSYRLVNLTEGAVQALPEEGVRRPEQATTWGLVRSFNREDPQLPVCVMDVGPEVFSSDPKLVIRVLQSIGEERQFALRSGSAYVARLAREQLLSGRGLEVDAFKRYVLIGGYGGIGRYVAHWLYAKGARRFVLIGRGASGASETVDFLVAQKDNGVTFEECHFEIGSDYDVRKLGFNTSVAGDIGAIFHLAGELNDGRLLDFSWSDFYKVFPSKAYVANSLVALAASSQAPVFFFSSISSMFGSPGQANYAAANAYLDALAGQNKANIFSISWGPWDGSGMAYRVKQANPSSFNKDGIDLLPPAMAMTVFERLDAEKGGHFGVALVNWGVWADKTRFFERLAADGADGVSRGQLLRELRLMPAKRRNAVLMTRLKDLVADTLRLDSSSFDVKDRLFDLGVDSLIAMSLKNQMQEELNVRLGSTLLFDYPSIERLSGYLIESFVPEDGFSSDAEPGDDGLKSVETDLDGLESLLNEIRSGLN